MAPPIPGLRKPPAIRHRSAGDVIAGVLAIFALAVLTVGVPVALIMVLGLPIPHAAPALSLLTRQLGILTIVRILSVIVWLAWIQLVCALVAEIRAAVRNVGVPARIPLTGGTQAVVHRLVSTALVLFSATAALSPALAGTGPPPRPATTVSVLAKTMPQDSHPRADPAEQERVTAAAADAAAGAAAAHDPTAEKIYVVKPPVGRFHESLWEIAENHLGNGLRYREIFEMNKDRVQPDGSRLTIACLIRPGWILHMPRDAYGPGVQIRAPGVPGGPVGAAERAIAGEIRHASAGQQASPGSAQIPGAQHTPSQNGHTPAASRSARPHGTATPGAGTHGTGTHGSGTPGTGPHGTGTHGPGTHGTGTHGSGTRNSGTQGSGTHGSESHGSGAAASTPVLSPRGGAFPYELAGAALLAAGVLAALGRRRREQLWGRAFGKRAVMPEGEAAVAETALRLGASEPAAVLLDTALRSMSQRLAARGKVPPTVFAAHLGQVNLDLWIAPADEDPPEPWLSVDDGQVWRLPLAAVPPQDPDAAAALAPYPGLVSIGTSDTGRMLVDLEVPRGVIAVRGPRRVVQAALAAMAVELATSRWSDEMQVTLAGFGDELAIVAPDRITVAATLDEVLPALEARAAELEHSLASLRADSVLAGRARGGDPAEWAPHYLIMAVPPAPRQRERLLTLASTSHRTAMGYAVAGDLPGATWTWDIAENGRLHAGVLGFDLAAQLLPPQQYAAVAELFRAAQEAGGVALADPPPDLVPPAHLVPASPMSVEVSLLGQVRVQAPGSIEPQRAAMATEIVAYLAAHAEGVHPSVLTAVIWPRGVTPEVRAAAFTRVRDWLGTDDDGQPNLVIDTSGRLSLGPQVRVDWQVFRALAAHAALARQAGEDRDEAAYLARALDLVRGQLLDGRDRRRYAWLAADPLEYEVTARVADAAHRLSWLRLTNGDPEGAMDAARAGLRLASDDELLWRDLLTAAHASGQDHLLRAVVAEVSARTAVPREGVRGMAPETEALIDELLPSWRSSVA